MLTRLRSFLAQLHWSRTFRAGGVVTWMQEPAVRRAINRAITGSENRWPMEWLQERYVPQPQARGLSLGCGTGALERDVIQKGICESVLGLDLAPAVLALAEEECQRAGLGGITYRRADLNRLDLPPQSFDIAFFHQSLHHIEDLDGCLAAVRSALVPGALLYLDEYVGPSRREWTNARIHAARAVYSELPAAVKRVRRVRFPIDRRDPTEAIRSSKILPTLTRHFTVREQRDYGGNLLAILYPNMALDRVSSDERQAILTTILGTERTLLARGVPSYYAVVVAAAE